MSSEYTDPRTSTPSAPVYTTDMLNNDININDRVSNLSSTNVSEAAFSAASSISSPNAHVNHWGYSLTENNVSGTYNPIPAYNTSQTIRDNVVTSVEHSYTPVTIGVNVDTDIASGTYTNNLVFSTITNPPYVDYTLDFNANTDNAGGDDGSVTNLPADITERVMATSYTVTIPSTAPSRSGYVFNGYNTKADGTGTTYQPGDNYTLVVEDRQSSQTEVSTSTLYAIWSQYTYTVTYNCNGGTGCPADHSATVGSLTYSYTIPSTTPSRNGYVFNGYNTKVDGAGDNYDIGDIYTLETDYETKTVSATLYAMWMADTYSVILDQQSGSGGTTSITATYDEVMPSITTPSRSGYAFGGYYTGTGGSGTQYYTATGDSIRAWDLTSGTTLYAKWTLQTWTDTSGKVWTYKLGAQAWASSSSLCPSGYHLPTVSEFFTLIGSTDYYNYGTNTTNINRAYTYWGGVSSLWASNGAGSDYARALRIYSNTSAHVNDYSKSYQLGIVCTR